MQQKKKICKSCQTEQYLFSKGRCKICTGKEDQKPLQRTQIKQKAYRIVPQTQKNKDFKKERSGIRDAYFEHHINLCERSEESGKSIYEPTRANICHLFDKSRHPSLQGNLNNFVYLTLDEHTRFDQLLYTHEFEKLEKEFPKAWLKVCERMKELLSLCEEKTKFYFKIEEYFYDN